MKDDRLYLIHIKECIERVIEYTEEAKTSSSLISRPRMRSCATCRYSPESSQRLSDSLKEKHPEVDWRNISGFRNVVVHEYLSIDVKRIWDIVEQDLPILEEQIGAIMRDGSVMKCPSLQEEDAETDGEAWAAVRPSRRGCRKGFGPT